MESTIRLKATDRQADYLNENYAIKLIEFKGDKEQYPNMDYNSPVVHPWRVVVRHPDEIGQLKGTYTYERLIKKIEPINKAI